MKHTTAILIGALFLKNFIFAHPLKDVAAIHDWLKSELEEEEISKQLTNILKHDVFIWKSVPKTPINEAQTIIAYAFGNRILPDGNLLPGPINKELADLVVKSHLESNAHVYAQWEISEAIGNRVSPELMTSITPSVDNEGNKKYLSTFGVAQFIMQSTKNAHKGIGKVAIIAFKDHLMRCISISRSLGIDAYAIEGYEMPNQYDPLSGQPWTRNRLIYLLHDLSGRVSAYRDKLIAEESCK